MIPLMLGRIPSHLAEAIQVDGSGILGPSALSAVNKKDEGAVVDQCATEPWPQLDLESAASQIKKRQSSVITIRQILLWATPLVMI